MIFDEEKYAKIGQKIFPLKSKGLSDFFYRDIQIAFGILASYMQKAEDNASHYQNELAKRDSEVLAEYKEKIDPLLKIVFIQCLNKKREQVRSFSLPIDCFTTKILMNKYIVSMNVSLAAELSVNVQFAMK